MARANCVPFYDAYWTFRGATEFERVFNRKPFANLGSDAPAQAQMETLLAEEMQKATTHFGEGRLNPSTIAWVIWRVEQRLLNLKS